MAFIETISPAKASGATADVYAYMNEVGGGGPVANIVRLFSIKPESMRRMIRTWEIGMWFGNAPRDPREMVASAVSRFADCHY